MKNSCRIYVSDRLHSDQCLVLNKDKMHYLKNVLRSECGDLVRTFNGKDGEWLTEILEFTKKSCTLKVLSNLKTQPLNRALQLIFAPLKQTRLNVLLEKSVELGVTELTPVLTEYTHVRELNIERARNIIIETAEQSERLCVPIIHALTPLPTLLNNWATEKPIYIGDERLKAPNLLTQLIHKVPLEPSLIIGPEGGFSPLEFELFSKYSFIHFASLGQTILRAETAAITGLAICQMTREAGVIDEKVV
jgi:16S rRNA (uracil1498-N3)-methyltransferase